MELTIAKLVYEMAKRIWCGYSFVRWSFTSRKGQTVVEYALATLAAFVIAMSFYYLFDLKIGAKKRNAMELQFYTIEHTVTKGWP